jgi:hypothetical protein
MQMPRLIGNGDMAKRFGREITLAAPTQRLAEIDFDVLLSAGGHAAVSTDLV